MSKKPEGPASLPDAEAALNAGKAESKPVVLLFVDDGKYSTAFLDILAHPFIGKDTWAKVAYAKVKFEKGSDLAKTWKVRKAPSMVILDNSGDAPKLIKTLRGGSAQSIKAALLGAAKKIGR